MAGYTSDDSFSESRAVCKRFRMGAIVASVASCTEYMPMLFSL